MGSQSTARAYRCNARRASAALRLFAADAVAVAIQVVFIRPDDPDSSGVDRAVSAAAFAVDIAGDGNVWVVRRVTFVRRLGRWWLGRRLGWRRWLGWRRRQRLGRWQRRRGGCRRGRRSRRYRRCLRRWLDRHTAHPVITSSAGTASSSAGTASATRMRFILTHPPAGYSPKASPRGRRTRVVRARLSLLP